MLRRILALAHLAPRPCLPGLSLPCPCAQCVQVRAAQH